jgi:hypothetical protein
MNIIAKLVAQFACFGGNTEGFVAMTIHLVLCEYIYNISVCIIILVKTY